MTQVAWAAQGALILALALALAPGPAWPQGRAPLALGWFDSVYPASTMARHIDAIASGYEDAQGRYLLLYNARAPDAPGWLAAIRTALDLAAARGMKVILAVYRPHVVAGDAEAITRFTEAMLPDGDGRLKDHTALSGWFLADEPIAHPTKYRGTIAGIRAAYQAVKATSALPVFIAFTTLRNPAGPADMDELTDFRDCVDVILWDDYEVFDNAAYLLTYWGDMRSLAAEAAAMQKEWWAVIQCTGYTRPLSLRLPTLQQATYAALVPVLLGASGVLWWHYGRSIESARGDGSGVFYRKDGRSWQADVAWPVNHRLERTAGISQDTAASGGSPSR